MSDGVIGRRSVLSAFVAANVASSASVLSARAQGAWPARTVKVVVPYAAGGLTDTIGRLLAQDFTEQLGGTFVVENRPGANGNIAMEAVARTTDDHTIFIANAGQIVVNPHTFGDALKIDPLKDLIPVSTVITSTIAVITNPQLKVATVAELIALLKKEPGKYHYATSGAGGITHVVAELFKKRVGAQMEAVHYRGAAPAQQDVLAGNIMITVDGLSNYEPVLRAGKLNAIMVASKERSAVVPDTPTAAESGISDFVFVDWFGVMAPNALPAPVIEKLAKATAAAMQRPTIRERLITLGVHPAGDSPKEFAERIARDYRIFGEVVKANDIRAN